MVYVRQHQTVAQQLRHPGGRGRAAGDAGEAAGVAKQSGLHRAHLPGAHEGFSVVVGQEAEEAPGKDQRGDRLLVEAGGVAAQALAVGDLHVGRVVAQAGMVSPNSSS